MFATILLCHMYFGNVDQPLMTTRSKKYYSVLSLLEGFLKDILTGTSYFMSCICQSDTRSNSS